VRDPWDVPVVRDSVAGLGPARLGLRYVTRRGERSGMWLRWEDSPLLELVVAHDDRRVPRTLAHVLERVRDVGGLVVAADGSRWRTLESTVPGLRTWSLTDAGDRVLPRILGEGCLWRMPTVPESHPRVAAAGEQPHLVLQRREVMRLLERAGTDTAARVALLAHALVVEHGGRQDPELERAPLVRRFDPRALAPVRLVSLDSLRGATHRPGLVFPGGASRDMPEAVVEATPAEASLLHEVLGLQPAATATMGVERSSHRVARRRRGRSLPPLVEQSVVDPLMVGALRVESHELHGGVALWASGLHADDIRWSGPLASVSGRLWLTPRGVAAGRKRIDRALQDWVHRLVRAAGSERHLMPPDSERRVALEAFVARCTEDPTLGKLLQRARGGDGDDPMLSLHRVPLRRLPRAGEERLLQILRQVTGLPLQIETAMLSWKAAKLVHAGADRRPPVLELGRRNAWVKAGLDPDGDLPGAFEAAAVILGMAWSRAEDGPLEPRAATMGVALYRLLALAYAHS
jgi:hypothetical protein